MFLKQDIKKGHNRAKNAIMPDTYSTGFGEPKPYIAAVEQQGNQNHFMETSISSVRDAVKEVPQLARKAGSLIMRKPGRKRLKRSNLALQ